MLLCGYTVSHQSISTDTVEGTELDLKSLSCCHMHAQLYSVFSSLYSSLSGSTAQMQDSPASSIFLKHFTAMADSLSPLLPSLLPLPLQSVLHL